MLVDRRLLDAPLLQPVDHWVVLVLSEHQIAHDQHLVLARLLEGRVGAKREPWLYINALGGDAEVAARHVDAVDVACHPLALFTHRLPDRVPVRRTSLFVLCLSTTPTAPTHNHEGNDDRHGQQSHYEWASSIQDAHPDPPCKRREFARSLSHRRRNLLKTEFSKQRLAACWQAIHTRQYIPITGYFPFPVRLRLP